MKITALTLVLAAAATAVAAGPLPLKPGTYVLTGSRCADHANAAEFSYDGRAFSYPHASHCVSKSISNKGMVYRLATTCSAAGDGSPTPPSTITSIYTVASPTQVLVRKARGRSGSAYRRCPAA